MTLEYREFAESRQNILRAALELGDRIAALRRSLERSGGLDSNSLDIKVMEETGWMKSARPIVATDPSA